MSVLKLKKDNKIISVSFNPPILLGDLLAEKGIYGFAPCGGKGKCGKCGVKISGNISAPTENELNAGTRLSCQTILYGDAEAELTSIAEELAYIEDNIGDLGSINAEWDYGAVIDIGTTTVAAKLFSGRGEILAECSCTNPQRSVSADVMGRISASVNGKQQILQQQILNCINGLLDNVCETAKLTVEDISQTVITGNTAMLYLLQGISAESIAKAPFKAERLFGEYVNAPVNAYLPRCINAFVGGDVTCGIIASGLWDKNQTALLCDMGTNGEIALYKEGRLYVTSTAAGPAFEGSEISCGCGYINGAVYNVTVKQGSIAASTVGNSPARGICGSGLISAVAAFLNLGYIDEDGKIASDLKITANGGSVLLKQEDIRALQLAKSAIASGIEILLSRTGTALSDIDKVYIAGGFGNGIFLQSAAEIGLIPKEFINKTEFLGNGALKGGAMLLFDNALKEKSVSVAKSAIHIELGGTRDFNSAFIKNMSF